MKKILVSAISLVLALFIFAGCSTPEASPSLYFKFGYDSEITEGEDKGLLETYEYDVKREYTENSAVKSAFLVGTGKYIVKIYKQDNNIYRVTSDFSFNGNYILKNDQNQETYRSDDVKDSVVAESTFSADNKNITAIKSVKTFKHSYIKNTEDNTLDKSQYTITSDYTQSAEGKTILTSSLVDIAGEGNIPAQTEANKNYVAEVEGRYSDNEHFFLMLRLQDLTTAFRDSFTVFDPFNAPSVPYKFDVSVISGTTQKEAESLKTIDISGLEIGVVPPTDNLVKCIQLSASLNAKFKGQPITMSFSKNVYLLYENTKNQADIQLLMEFKQENFDYQLVKYSNTAQKAQ